MRTVTAPHETSSLFDLVTVPVLVRIRRQDLHLLQMSSAIKRPYLTNVLRRK